MLSVLWNLVVFIIVLGVLVTMHELDRFWVACRYGIRTECLSIGFGKALWWRMGKQDTEFMIALIPLGGYVRTLDERVEAVTPEMHYYALNNKTVGQRAVMVAAGPIANFISATFVYQLVFIIGVPDVRPVVGEIAPNSAIVRARIVKGTKLKVIDGIETPDWDVVCIQLIAEIGNP